MAPILTIFGPNRSRRRELNYKKLNGCTNEEANETFINDPEMRKRLLELNPNSFRQIVGTLLEVHGRGYWETSDENIEQLQELYQEVEDRIEGVVTD